MIKKHLLLLTIIPILTIFSISVEANANALFQFLQSLKTLNIRFVQIEVDESNFSEKISYGNLLVKIPGKFRWINDNADEQMIYANGTDLWIYEPSLNQASLYQQKTLLHNTPAVLLSSPKTFKKNFLLDSIREDENGTWFDLSPKQENSYYDYMEVRLEKRKITQIIIRNRINNIYTRIEFYYDKNSLNQPINDKPFEFIPPTEADILGE